MKYAVNKHTQLLGSGSKMRYYGKQGAQTRRPEVHCENMVHDLRMRARAVLFGRVSNNIVMWLGLVLMVFTIMLGVLGLSNLATNRDHFMQDAQSHMMIRR